MYLSNILANRYHNLNILKQILWYSNIMKQNDKIIKKGDYYELENTEEVIYQQKQIRKEEIPSSLSITGADQIITQIPTYAEARSAYFFTKTKRDISNCGLNDLIDELKEMLNEKNDEATTNQINSLIKQIQLCKKENIVPLNKMPKEDSSQVTHMSLPKEIKLTLQLNLEGLQQRLRKLQELNYPQLSQIENIVEIMIGQKATNPQNITHIANTLHNLDQKSKQDIQSIYTHLSTLTCLNNLYNLIEDIHHNDGKYIQMSSWVKKAELVAEMNKDFMIELEADFTLVEQLQKNFKENIKHLKNILDNYRKKITEIKALKKK